MDAHAYLPPIIQFYRERRRMPSMQELTTLYGFHSKNAAFKVVNKLVEAGLVTKDQTGRLLPTHHFSPLRVLGTVEAGFPSPAEEELGDTMNLDEFLIRNKEATYMLKVTGDSMVDAGLLPGDLVLVERRSNAKDGDIVIAQIDQGWTMKYLRKRGRKFWLEPANKKYHPIYPSQELHIATVVIASIRKY
jgi:SOS regulatory protein LexA